MVQALNTLYVSTPGAYLRLDNDTLRVEVERETRLRVPLHHLSAVVVLGDVMVTPAALAALADEGRALTFLDRNGRFKARLEGPMSGNVLLRSAQHKLGQNEEAATHLARNLVAGKVQNCRQVLMRGAREAKSDTDAQALRNAGQALETTLKHLPRATTLDELRGYEGDAARHYFAAFAHLIAPELREAFPFGGRTRRPPRDAANALLSFLYSLLMNDCRSALEATGLDPQVGFLHALRPGRAALALDLMEEFRPILADRVALTLINRRQLTARDFEHLPGGAVQMTDSARRTVITTYQNRKQETIQHPLLSEPPALGLVPFLQARLLARTLRQDTPEYLPFLIR
jgi:CRISPR-associated protein Cas1